MKPTIEYRPSRIKIPNANIHKTAPIDMSAVAEAYGHTKPFEPMDFAEILSLKAKECDRKRRNREAQKRFRARKKAALSDLP
jgi:hypothetical protein